MTERIWHSGPPPHVGWWNASSICDTQMWRWWDGKKWSRCVLAFDSLYQADDAARTPQVYRTWAIEWTDYWPEGARVPRVAP